MSNEWEEAIPVEKFKQKPEPTDDLPPNSTESEEGVLGCCLLDPRTSIPSCIQQLDGPEAFYDLRLRTIYECFVEMHQTGTHIDLITLQQRLKDRSVLDKVGGLAYLSSLHDKTPAATNLDHYLEILKDKHTLRKLQVLCVTTTEKIKTARDAESLVCSFQAEAIRLSQTNARREIEARQCATRYTNDLQTRVDLQGQPSGILTGLCDYDRITDGLQYGEQVVIGARPSQGKTALGLSIIHYACIMCNIPSLFITFEMSVEAIMRRLAAIHTRTGMRALRTGQLRQEDMAKMPEFVSSFRRYPLTIVDYINGAGANTVAATIERGAQAGVKLVVIDYMQKIKSPTKNEKRTYEIGEVSGILKASAERNKVAMLTLAQLNREPDKGGKNGQARFPRVSDLADSGQIERDADVIGLLYREHRDSPSAMLIVAKNRDGECGIVSLHFHGMYCHFTNGTNNTPQI